MTLQQLPSVYLPRPEQLPLRVHALPELHYPRRLNACVELLDRRVRAGWGSQSVFHFEERSLTYAQILNDVNRLGNGLRHLGVTPGDRVLVRLNDQPELVVAILALLKLGAIPVPTYPLLKGSDILYRERDTEAKAVIVGADLTEEVEKVRPDFEHAKILVVVSDSDLPQYESYTTLLAGGSTTLEAAPTMWDDIALILYTSGSTGEPKGTFHSHSDLLAIADTYCSRCVQPKPGDVFIGPPPIPFAAGLGYYLVFPLRCGLSAVLLKEKSPDYVCDMIIKHHGTIFAGMATYYNMLLGQKKSGLKVCFGNVRQTLVGGEPVAGELSERWQAETGHSLVQFLGTTEMLHIFLSSRPDIDVLRPNSVGRPVPGYQVAIRDPERFHEVDRGQPGILTVIGPTGTRYWRKPAEQGGAVRNGWNVTQDLVQMDDDGYVYHIARVDDMIISGGYNISPVEVENILLRHPAVAETGCIGVPDPAGVRSNIVKAYVVVRPGISPTISLIEELQQFVRAKGAPYLYPREVTFINELPKTLTGKIKRSDLRQRTKDFLPKK